MLRLAAYPAPASRDVKHAANSPRRGRTARGAFRTTLAAAAKRT